MHGVEKMDAGLPSGEKYMYLTVCCVHVFSRLGGAYECDK